MTNRPPERFVEVVWTDAYADKPTKAFTVEEVTHADADNLPVITRGWLLRQDEKGVSLAAEVYFNTDDQKWNYRGKTFILKSMVNTIEDWPPVKVKRVRKSKVPADLLTIDVVGG
jgi:hypothetical protein